MNKSLIPNILKALFISPEVLTLVILVAFYLFLPRPLIFMGEIIKKISSYENICLGIPLAFIIYVLNQFGKILHPSDPRIYKWQQYNILKITMYIAVFYSLSSGLCVILSILFKDNLSKPLLGGIYLSGFLIAFVTSATVFIALNELKEILNSIDSDKTYKTTKPDA